MPARITEGSAPVSTTKKATVPVPNRKHEQRVRVHQAAVHRQLRFQLGSCRNIKRQRREVDRGRLDR